MSESQICQKCGTSRPIEQFQLMKGIKWFNDSQLIKKKG